MTRRYEQVPIIKYLPKCAVGGLALILLTTNAFSFFGMKKLLDQASVDKNIRAYGTSKYVREFMDRNKLENNFLNITETIFMGLGKEIAYKTHKD